MGVEGMRRRGYMEWEAQNRFEELDTDEDPYDYPRRGYRMPEDKLHFTGYDIGRRRQNFYEDDVAYRDDYEIEDEYDQDEYDQDELDEGTRWQLEQQQRELDLAAQAARRIARARLRGNEAPLSREEIDALERRQLIPLPNEALPSELEPQARSASRASASTKPAAVKVKRKPVASASASNSPSPARKTKASKTSFRTPPVSQDPPRSRTPPRRVSEGARSAATAPGRSESRSTSRSNARDAMRMPDAREYQYSRRPSHPARPYEDDLHRRARSTSAAQYYGNPSRHAYGPGYGYGYGYPPEPMPRYPPMPPYAPQLQRRNISGPAAMQSDRPRPPTRGRREPEVIVISDQDEDEVENTSDDTSDQGVPLEAAPPEEVPSHSGARQSPSRVEPTVRARKRRLL